jgi:hypothetical protein
MKNTEVRRPVWCRPFVAASMSGIAASAIYNAIGMWVIDYPTTADKILKALGKV